MQDDTHAAPASEEMARTREADAMPPPGAGSRAEPEASGEVARLRAELKDTKDRLLRQAAEFQNYKRRTDTERLTIVQSSQVHVVQRMLEVLDDLGRSLDAASKLESDQQALDPMYVKLKEGVELVFRKFNDEMVRLGVEHIQAVGQPFNENEHDALMQQPAPADTEAGVVLSELQKGYRMGDRVIRHTKVVVSS
ncbi:MAG: nucleotide exchange factor GrpE [Rhodothermales bacterium]|nr:nucleotide exchange factor GrpE [Rhodothermales bacterium]